MIQEQETIDVCKRWFMTDNEVRSF